MKERKEYHSCCIGGDYESLVAMIEAAEETTREEFVEGVDAESLSEIEEALSYDESFPMSNDWHVTYHRSTYRGEPCQYFRHSAIEYIFI